MPLLPFFAASLTWNLGLGMTYLLVPLHAQAIGLSAVEIGSLLSFPVLAQFALNLLGGSYSDRLGGKRLALSSCVATTVAGPLFLVAHSFLGLLVAQLVLVAGRAMFWPATWSLASQSPGDRGLVMGRLNSLTSAGQIIGTGGAGFVIATFGFVTGFLVYSLTNVVSFVLLSAFRAPGPARTARSRAMLATYRALLARRPIQFAMITAYLSALPFSLSASFYPLLLTEQGFESGPAGVILALRAVGAIAAGLVAGRFIKSSAARVTPIAAAVAIAGGVGFGAAFRDPMVVSFFMLAVGLGSGVLTLFFQMIVSDVSKPEERGSAMAIGGLGWSISHFSTPVVMGAMTQTLGIVPAFHLLGAIALVASLALVPLHAWAFPRSAK